MPAAHTSSFGSTMCEGPAHAVCHTPLTALSGLAPPLTPKPMTPLRFHKGVEAALRLDNIEWFEIIGTEKDPSNHTLYFTINVFTKKDQSRLPTTGLVHKPTLKRALQPMVKPNRAEPDFCIRRSFVEFKTLFDDVMLTVQKSHGQFCHLCNDFQTLLLFTNTRPVMTFRALFTLDRQAKVVQKLLRDLVSHFQARQPTAGRRDGCQAAHEIPLILHAFLLENES